MIRYALTFFLLCFVLLEGHQPAPAQMSAGGFENFFLDSPPTAAALSKAPAQNVTVAKVRVKNVALLRGRHPWDPPQPRPNELYGVQIEVMEILSGGAKMGPHPVVYFGTSGSETKYKFPHTPGMRSRDYFIAFYTNENRNYGLIGFPITQEEYDAWDREVWAHERERSKPGAVDVR